MHLQKLDERKRAVPAATWADLLAIAGRFGIELQTRRDRAG